MPLVQYPPWTVPAKHFLKNYLYHSVVGCTVLTLLCFKAHIAATDYLRRDAGLSDQAIFTVLLSVSHTVIYLVVNGIFSSGWPSLEQFKFKRSKAQTPTPDLINSTLITALISHLVSSPVMTYYLYPFFCSLGLKALDAPCPSVAELARTFLIAHAFNDFGFYLTHRWLHTPGIYEAIHKQHHQYKGSLGIAAEYANPVEVVLSNILPSLGGAVLPLGGCQHPLCVVVWLTMRLYQTYCAHGGMVFSGTWLELIGFDHAESAAFHDHHHSVNQGNYGSVLTDWLFGSLDEWIKGGYVEGYCAKNGKTLQKQL